MLAMLRSLIGHAYARWLARHATTRVDQRLAAEIRDLQGRITRQLADAQRETSEAS